METSSYLQQMKTAWQIFIIAVLCAGLMLLGAPAIKNINFAGLEKTLSKEDYAMLVPHRALYRVRLVSIKSNALISNISGSAIYEWQSDCNSSVLNQYMDTRYEYPQQGAIDVTSRFAAHEAYDGSSYDYIFTRKHNGRLMSQSRGSIGADKIAHIQLLGGEVIEKPLGKESVYPIWLTREVMKSIQEGVTFDRSRLFDGSDDEYAAMVSTVMLGEAPTYQPDLNSSKIDESLLAGKAYRMRMAFFPEDAADTEVAEYETDIIIQENGVIRAMNIEYDDFSLVQELVALEEMKDLCRAEE